MHLVPACSRSQTSQLQLKSMGLGALCPSQAQWGPACLTDPSGEHKGTGTTPKRSPQPSPFIPCPSASRKQRGEESGCNSLQGSRGKETKQKKGQIHVGFGRKTPSAVETSEWKEIGECWEGRDQERGRFWAKKGDFFLFRERTHGSTAPCAQRQGTWGASLAWLCEPKPTSKALKRHC